MDGLLQFKEGNVFSGARICPIRTLRSLTMDLRETHFPTFSSNGVALRSVEVTGEFILSYASHQSRPLAFRVSESCAFLV